MKIEITTFTVAALLALSSCSSGPKTDPRYPPRPAGCAVQLFRGKIMSTPYDDIAHVDAICGTDIGIDECLKGAQEPDLQLGRRSRSTTSPTSHSKPSRS